jgi:hypothetical protein
MPELSTIVDRVLQNASSCAKSFLELALLIFFSIPFTHVSDSMLECYFHFLNGQKQTLGGVKNAKSNKNP